MLVHVYIVAKGTLMRSDTWKKLFKQNGWLQGDRILLPKDASITFAGAHQCPISVSPILYWNEDYIIEKSSGPDKGRYYLWEDITAVIL